MSLPIFRQPPLSVLANLFRLNGDSRCNNFLRKICQYNCLYAFTSMGARIDQAINRCGGPYVFQICGQVYHRIGSLVLCANSPPRFVELYIYDTENEVTNTIHALDPSEGAEGDLDLCIVSDLMCMLDEYNLLVQ